MCNKHTVDDIQAVFNGEVAVVTIECNVAVVGCEALLAPVTWCPI